jgi:hypothetical protein
MTTYTNLIPALHEYEASREARDKEFIATKNTREMKAWARKEKIAREKVADAFFEDTKDYNSREKCSLPSIKVLREWAGLPPVPENLHPDSVLALPDYVF